LSKSETSFDKPLELLHI